MLRAWLTRGMIFAVLVLGVPAWAFEKPDFVVIVHPSNPVSAMSRLDLERIYRKDIKFWPDGEHVIPINAPSSSKVRASFNKTVLRSSIDALVTFWNRKYFGGETPPLVLRSSDAILSYVAQRPNAIGYVPAGYSIEGTRVVPIRFDD